MLGMFRGVYEQLEHRAEGQMYQDACRMRKGVRTRCGGAGVKRDVRERPLQDVRRGVHYLREGLRDVQGRPLPALCRGVQGMRAAVQGDSRVA